MCRVVNTVAHIGALLIVVGRPTFADAASSPEAVPEYNVKAAYLLLFARYVRWPEDAFAAADAPLIIAVLGRDPFGQILDETMRDQRVDTHPVKIMRAAGTDGRLSAHIVFIASGQKRAEQVWFDNLRSRSVLTVGESGSESASASSDGPIICFVHDGNKIRFDIDLEAARRAKLRIASPMLVSARSLRNVTAPPESRTP